MTAPNLQQSEIYTQVQARLASSASQPKAAEVGPAAQKKENQKSASSQQAAGTSASDAIKSFVNPTPNGQKKSFTSPMDTSYEPHVVEASWDAWWESQKYFTPDSSKESGNQNLAEENKFVMVIPPPNVTGNLHLGHAITSAIEDCLTRWHRQCGKTTLWVPGTDHAGIATQSVVERIMLKNEGKTRHDLGREKFLEKVWAWKNQYGGNICNQLRRLGASVDWTREAFTMDENLTRAVKHGFVNFYKQGLIYRDTRLINWCSYLKTALSDLEVDYEDITERKLLTKVPGLPEGCRVEVGVMCHFDYVLADDPSKKLTVATTRLETMLGDTAVSVHPEDARYKEFVGRFVKHPFFPNRKIPVIADTYIKMDEGTGCMKVTPAHDHNDYKLGKQHKLEFINILDDDGTICKKACAGSPFAGMHRFVARREVELELTKLNLFKEKKNNAMRLGFCSRSGDIIEPLLRPQWWMNCDHVAAESVKAVETGELKIVPSFHEQTWFHWLKNIQQWCISRQLWWGHQIPAYKLVEPKDLANKFGADGKWFVGVSKEDAVKEAAKELKIDASKIILEQDEDVLDTWFSSGLFPFSVMGWPEQTDDMKSFFPGQLLETGHDILFFWVARMVMMSLGLTGKLPFKTVYLHAMVRDKNGEKMSKSKGNVIDPLEVIDGCSLQALHDKVQSGNLPEKEIKKAIADQKVMFPQGIPSCGADALRFGLLAYTAQGRNVNLDLQRIVGYRHFCNKLWNATKFALQHLASDSSYKYAGALRPNTKLRLEDKWILSRLSHAGKSINKSFKEYNFSEAVQSIYSFWLYELCDVYLETLKPRLHSTNEADKPDQTAARDVLYTCLDQGLRLLHPMLPFVTEELYQRLPPSPAKYESICIATYPTGVNAWCDPVAEDEFARSQEVISALRSAMAQLQILPKMNPKAFVINSEKEKQFSNQMISVIKVLSRVGELTLAGKNPEGMLVSPVNPSTNIALDAKELIDLNLEMKNKLKKIEAAKKMIADVQKKMNVPNYEEKTPDNIKAKNTEKIEAVEKELAELEKGKAFLEAAMK